MRKNDTESWLGKFNKLKMLYEDRGISNRYEVEFAPQNGLGAWCNNQRIAYRLNLKNMTPDRIEALNSIGFLWNILDYKWLQKYEELKLYMLQHGGKEPNNNNSIDRWCTNQRVAYSNCKLSPERFKLLKAIGFVFGFHNDERWHERYRELKAFHHSYGHTRISSKTSSLGVWCDAQRKAYRSGKLDSARVAALDAIGFKYKIKNGVAL